MVKSEGRFTEGPAMSIATAAPIGAPAESRINANGISKNVGIASGTAIKATTTIDRFVELFTAARTGRGSAAVSQPERIRGTARDNAPNTTPGAYQR